MLEAYLRAGSGEFGSGVPSARLQRLFGPASMVVTRGQGAHEPNADYRAEACRYHDTRLTNAAKLANIHATLRSSMAEARLSLDRIEKFLRSLTPPDRAEPELQAAMAGIAADTALGRRLLLLARDTGDPAVRLRLIALARDLGWLTPEGVRAEHLRLIGELLASRASGFHEVSLVCTLNRDGALDGSGDPLHQGMASRATNHAALACLGHPDSRSRVLEALASASEEDVQVAAAYLRHRPLSGIEELRNVTLSVARMGNPAAQARAVEALARLHVTDEAALQELARLHARTRSPAVRSAVEEVYLRAGIPFNGTPRAPSSTRAPARSG
jgi:hypothetical protein